MFPISFYFNEDGLEYNGGPIALKALVILPPKAFYERFEAL
jgi:hypothetical protein